MGDRKKIHCPTFYLNAEHIFSGNTICILNLGCWIQVSAFSSCGWFGYFTHREQAWSLTLCNFYFAIRLFWVVWDYHMERLIHFWPYLTPYKYLHFLFSMSQYSSGYKSNWKNQRREEYRYRMDFYWVSSMSSPRPGTLDTLFLISIPKLARILMYLYTLSNFLEDKISVVWYRGKLGIWKSIRQWSWTFAWLFK